MGISSDNSFDRRTLFLGTASAGLSLALYHLTHKSELSPLKELEKNLAVIQHLLNEFCEVISSYVSDQVVDKADIKSINSLLKGCKQRSFETATIISEQFKIIEAKISENNYTFLNSPDFINAAGSMTNIAMDPVGKPLLLENTPLRRSNFTSLENLIIDPKKGLHLGIVFMEDDTPKDLLKKFSAINRSLSALNNEFEYLRLAQLRSLK